MTDFSLKSWVESAHNSDFPIQNLPFGIFSTSKKSARAGVAIGNKIVDLLELALNNFIEVEVELLNQDSLNALMELGRPAATKLRNQIQDLLSEDNDQLKDSTHRGSVMVNMSEATMYMPVKVGDYTDFYSSEDHARNVGTMFRDPENALLPNWKHLPVGYHGRASSIVVSPASIHRPKGQTKADDATAPSFGPTRLFDFELEMAFITCKKTKLGESIPVNEAENAIWGMVIFNDLSARDIQKWEYVPLGPFLAKNFGSVISPWVVTMDALEPFRTKGYKQDPKVLPYLKHKKDANFDIHLEVALQPENGQAENICTSNYKYMYWNMNQQLAHQTVNGCNLNVGDIYASGTISGPNENSYGSMLELSWKGTKPIKLSDGSERKFMQDGDTCIMRAHAEKEGVRIGFGESAVKILPAI
ncbi:MAG: fumarylacetoacetase [Chitinophagales bacterium]|nr:fumarylacetoacetase [Chitinophagales bacterium]